MCEDCAARGLVSSEINPLGGIILRGFRRKTTKELANFNENEF